MDANDLQDVQAEVIAIQAALIALFRQMAARYPDLRNVLESAFDEAEIIMSGVAVRLGMEPMLGTTKAALTIIAEFRSAILPRQVEDGASLAWDDRSLSRQ